MKYFQNLTLGFYYPTSSSIHSLDPRVKLLGLLLSAITLFALERVWGLGFFFLASLWLIRCAKLPVVTVLRGLRPFAGLFLLTACIQLFFTPGQPLFTADLGPLNVTREGLYQAVRVGGQLALVILLSSILTLTTSPLELLRALEKLAKPLNRIRVPVADLCLAMMLCIRFLPILSQEAQRIMEAQMVRGIDPTFGSWRNRLKKFHGIFLPLIYNVLARAEELATAMVVRGYGQSMTKMKYMRFSMADHLGLALVTIWCFTIFWFCRA
jgi:energy-coupling factor transport system permease protein